MTDIRSRMISVKELEVVGYADVLRPGTVPRRVAPIFRYRVTAGAPMDYVFPPFRLVDEFIINGTVGIESDLDSAVTARRATRLGQPISAQPSSVLWIDENLDPHYGPQMEVNANLQYQAKEKYRQAKEAFWQGQYDKARQLARWAFAADQRCWMALVLQAAMRRLEGDEQGVAVMAHLAADLVIVEDFDAQVGHFTKEVSSESHAGPAALRQAKSEDDSERWRAVAEALSRENEEKDQKIKRLRLRVSGGISRGHQAAGSLFEASKYIHKAARYLSGQDKILGGGLEDELSLHGAMSELAVFPSTEKRPKVLAQKEWPEDAGLATSKALCLREIKGINRYNVGLLFGHTLSEDAVAMHKMATSTVR